MAEDHGARHDVICHSDVGDMRLETLHDANEELGDTEGDDSVQDSSPTKGRCARCNENCIQLCRPCLTQYNPLPNYPSPCDSIKYSLLCPPHGKVARLVTVLLTVCLGWGALWAIFGAMALPGGSIFALAVLLIVCLVGGAVVSLVHLPPLLGMLLIGCSLRNIPHIDIAKDIDPNWASALRTMALVVILTRAGLGLCPKALRKLSGAVIRLAFLPCLFECVTVAIASHELFSFPWEWGFMLGFVLAAVSPAVVVPCLLSLQERGYGTDKGIPTLVIAAASIDDVLAISGFGVVLSIAFSGDNIALTIIKGPLEALGGIAFGIVGGILLWFIPHQKNENLTLFRVFLLLGGGLFAVFGSQSAGIPGAGALGCLTLAFVAALRWRQEEGFQEWESPITDAMSKIWFIFQPLLFGLIGAEVDLSQLEGSTIGLGIAILCIGLLVRIVVSLMSVFGTELNIKERLFIPLAWLPKATVQAAIGPVALDMARKGNESLEKQELGAKVLTIAVLVILITAPVGAIAIALSGPRLLHKEAGNKPRREHHEENGHTSTSIGPEVVHELIAKRVSNTSFSSDFITQDSMERMSAHV